MSDTSGFGKFVPGFEFLQNLAGQAAGGVAQGLEKSIPQLPNLGNWVAPTFNVEDLEKRIEELKAVHFWLDQNAKALGATIQALEVQKMTLATLKTMNFSLGDVANALKIKAADTVANFTGATPARAASGTQFAGLEIPPRTYGAPAPADAGEPAAAPPPAPRRRPPARKSKPAASASVPAGGVVDPVQWWGALSQQFQSIAANAMKDAARQTTLDTTRKVASGLTEHAVKTTTGMAGKATRAVTSRVARNVGAAAGMGKAAVRAVSGKAAGNKGAPQPLSAGDWQLPTAFFPGLQPAAAVPSATKTPARKPAAVKKAAARKPAAGKSAGRKTAAPSRRR